jgi:hypothetical protein
MQLLAAEIGYANTMKGLPAPERLAYYKANVPPIKEKEAQVAKDWVAITEQAKANGIPLPPNLGQSASNR